MTVSFCEKPTEIRERLNGSGSDDFGLFPLEADRLFLVKERRSEGQS